MLELEKDIYSCLNDIYKDNKLDDRVYPNKLPLDYKFNNHKVGIYYTINNVSDMNYKNTITLDVNFYCLDKDKIDMLKVIDNFDNNLKDKIFDNYWIIHKNVWLIPIKEDNLFHYVLSYNINEY